MRGDPSGGQAQGRLIAGPARGSRALTCGLAGAMARRPQTHRTQHDEQGQANYAALDSGKQIPTRQYWAGRIQAKIQRSGETEEESGADHRTWAGRTQLAGRVWAEIRDDPRQF